jgi:hypothetical protein
MRDLMETPAVRLWAAILVPFAARLGADWTIWIRRGLRDATPSRGGDRPWRRYLVAPVRDAFWFVLATAVASVVIAQVAVAIDTAGGALEIATAAFIGAVVVSSVWLYLRLRVDDRRRREQARDAR